MVLYGCAAILLSATVLAIAIIIRSDVLARGQASSAEYAARADVTTAMLTATYQWVQSTPEAPPSADLQVNLLADSSHVRVAAGGSLEVKVRNGDWEPVSRLRKAAQDT